MIKENSEFDFYRMSEKCIQFQFFVNLFVDNLCALIKCMLNYCLRDDFTIIYIYKLKNLLTSFKIIVRLYLTVRMLKLKIVSE